MIKRKQKSEKRNHGKSGREIAVDPFINGYLTGSNFRMVIIGECCGRSNIRIQ